MAERAAIAMGSNVGDRAAHLARAAEALASLPATRLLARSTPREYAALRVGEADPGGTYLNAAAIIETSLAPLALLDALQAIERDAGRDRSLPRGSPRVLDLDLVLYGDSPYSDRRLTVPHAGLTARRFVLEPLAEIAPDWPVPGAGVTVSQALARLAADARPPSVAGSSPAAPRPLISLLVSALAVAAAGPVTRGQPAAPVRPAPTERGRLAQPVDVPVDAAWADIRRGYAAGPSAERVAMTVRTERGSRRDEVMIRLDPAARAAALDLGTVRVWALPAAADPPPPPDRPAAAASAHAEPGTEVLVTDVRAGDTYFRSRRPAASPADALARVLPPLPLPQIALALGGFDPQRPLGDAGSPVRWSSARVDPAAALITLTGTTAYGEASLVADARSGRLKQLTLPVGPGVVIELQIAPEPAAPLAGRRPSLEGRTAVNSPAELRSRRGVEPPNDPPPDRGE